MKQDIHPNYTVLKVKCSCGNKFETKSTYTKGDSLTVSICSGCHPFYTGKHKFVDETGRVEKFKQKFNLPS